MTPDTRLELRKLFKKIALIALLLACVAGALLYFLPTANGQMLAMLLLVLTAGGSGYRCAALSPIWAASAWLKGLLCLGAVLLSVTVLAAAFTAGLFAHGVATGGSSSSSSGGFSSRSFD